MDLYKSKNLELMGRIKGENKVGMRVGEGSSGEEHVRVLRVMQGVKKDVKAVGTLGLVWSYGAFEVCQCPCWVMIFMR